MRKLLGIIPLMTIALLAGCGDDDDPTGPDGGAEGLVQHTYSGDLSGSFRAEADIDPTTDRNPEPASFAFAVEASNGYVSVFAFQLTSGGTGHVTMFTMSDASEGAHPLGFEACIEDSGDECALLYFGEDVDFSDADGSGVTNQLVAVSRTGEVRVSARSDDRIRGTFSSTLDLVEDDERAGTVDVTGGQFDVALYTEAELSGAFSRAPSGARAMIRAALDGAGF